MIMIIQSYPMSALTTQPLQLDIQIEVSTLYLMVDCHVTYPTIVSFNQKLSVAYFQYFTFLAQLGQLWLSFLK